MRVRSSFDGLLTERYYMLQNKNVSIQHTASFYSYQGVKSSISGTPSERNVSNVLSSHGDFKTPTRHRYSILETDPLTGTIFGNYGTFFQNRTVGPVRAGLYPGANAVFFNQRNNVYNTCLERFYEQFRGNLDLSIDLLEYKQTKSMVKESIPKLIRLTKTLLSRKEMVKLGNLDWRNGFTVPADLWLEYTYGLKPLMQDIHDAYSLMQNKTNENLVNLFKASAKAKYETQYDFTTNSSEPKQISAFTGISSCRMSGGLRSLNAETNLSVWTSLNPVSIAWETTTLSFVLDWVYDVGGYLRNYETAIVASRYFTNGVTQRLDYGLFTHSMKGLSPNGENFYNLTGGKTKVIDYDRTPVVQPPIPAIPEIKYSLGANRMISLAALLSQLLKKR